MPQTVGPETSFNWISAKFELLETFLLRLPRSKAAVSAFITTKPSESRLFSQQIFHHRVADKSIGVINNIICGYITVIVAVPLPWPCNYAREELSWFC